MGNAADSGDPPEGGTWHEWGGEWDPGPFGIMANLAGAVTGRQTGRMNESDRLRKLLENLRFLQWGKASVWPPALTKNAEGKKAEKWKTLRMGNLESATATLHKV
ncbi:RTA1 domain protein [Aspergillus tubingensis]|uniref:RTA1 domain protein n=1 Tax=Aspergillus tubingensis TaxID=5068 RepID=UPI001579B18B|nr:RTA1 domain protein [Aspergillus tubingensis]GFN19542.1 RTA1 domain protein [Aspergillus tubingensis]